MANQLYFLPMGYCDCLDSVLTPETATGKRLKVPIWSYLIKTPSANILFDTGMPHICVTDPRSLFPNTENIIPVMQEEDKVEKRLNQLGLMVDDIDLVINSHFHFDHAGGNAAFPNHTILVQKDELDLYNPDVAGFQIAPNRYQTVQGQKEIAAGVYLLPTPGHTPGHQSLLVRTEDSGAFVITSDAVYTSANFTPENLGAMWNATQGATSVTYLQDVQLQEKARVFFSHDPEQGRLFERAPFAYR